MRRARTIERTEPDLSDSQQALLVVSPDGRVQFATALAVAWLKNFSGSRSNRLPQALTGWLEEVRSSSQPSRFILDRGDTQLRLQIMCRDSKSVCLLVEQRARALGARGKTCALLTQREIEVLSWVARGKTNAEIAKILNLKPGTIGKYLERIFPKLGVENRTAAASFVLGANDIS
jgi:DNA-binding CsgD family transcriptional regulator